MSKNHAIDFLENYEHLYTTDDQNIVAELRNHAAITAKKLEAAKQESQLLKIGIVGQIKRGKSSFINALLFNGDDVLPKAATPMTAALTKIRYSPTPSATVEFFSRNEWSMVEEISKGWDPQKGSSNPADVQSCHELVEAAQEGGLNPVEFLDKGPCVISEFHSTKDLVGKLDEYVGVNGRYTPFVKFTELNLDLPELQGIEFIDTPGMNDPIISRSQRTRDFLGECHAVFLLTLSDQFLDDKDLMLLAQSLPNSAVSCYFLIGSMFDLVLMDCHNDYENIATAMKEEIAKATRKAQLDFDRYNNAKNADNYVIEAVGKSLPPHFISSMAYNLAAHWENLSGSELEHLTKLNQLFKGYTLTQDLLYKIASFDGIKKKLEEAKLQRDQLIDRKVADIEARAPIAYGEYLQSLKTNMEHHLKVLLEGDAQALAKSHQILMDKLTSSNVQVNGLFESHCIEMEKNFARILIEIQDAANQATRLEVKTGSESRSYTTGHFFWKRTHTYSVSYQYVQTMDSVQQLEDFVGQAEKDLVEGIQNIIDLDSFKKSLIQVLRKMFDTSSDNFKPEDILIPVGNAVNRITIPTLELNVRQHIETIRTKFNSAQVRDNEINSLKTEQSRVAQIILQDIRAEVKEQTAGMVQKLMQAQQNFLPGLTKSLKDELAKLESDLQDKEEKEKQYKELIRELSNFNN